MYRLWGTPTLIGQQSANSAINRRATSDTKEEYNLYKQCLSNCIHEKGSSLLRSPTAPASLQEAVALRPLKEQSTAKQHTGGGDIPSVLYEHWKRTVRRGLGRAHCFSRHGPHRKRFLWFLLHRGRVGTLPDRLAHPCTYHLHRF